MAKFQIIKYKCCGKIFAACVEPYFYEDTSWQKDMRKYIKQGHKVETVENNDFELGECKCENKKEPSLFT